VLVHQQIAHNASFKENMKHFYSTTVVFTHVLMVTSKILTLTNAYVQLMGILLMSQQISANHALMNVTPVLDQVKFNVIIVLLGIF